MTDTTKVETEITGMIMASGSVDHSGDLYAAVEAIRKACRKKDVLAVDAKLVLDELLILSISAVDRGKYFQVPLQEGPLKTYELTVDGVHKAVADLIRTKYDGKSPYIDVYQRMLGL